MLEHRGRRETGVFRRQDWTPRVSQEILQLLRFVSDKINLLATDFIFQILAHSVFKM